MSEALKPFDEKAKCPKCGFEGIASLHRPEADRDALWFERKHMRFDLPEHEFIHRRCQRCNFDWPEAVLTDAREASQESGGNG